jgi:uncharacterized membrane protein YbhN (UPF0104 family)
MRISPTAHHPDRRARTSKDPSRSAAPPAAVAPATPPRELLALVRGQVLRPRTLLSGLAAPLLAYLLARHLADLQLAEILAAVRHADPRLLILALVVFYLTFSVRAARWQILLANVGFTRANGYPMPSFLGLVRLMVVAAFANSITVAQIGDAYRAYLLRREARTSFAVGAGTILTERIIDVAVLVALLSAAALAAVAGHVPGRADDVLAIGLLASGLGMGALVTLRRWRPLVLRLLPGRWHAAYRRFEVGTVDSVARVPRLVGYSALGWLLEGATMFLLTAAVGAPVSPFGALVAGLVASLVSSEPVTPGGLGVTETGIVLVLTGLGVGPDTAAAVAVLNRIVNYLSLAVVGPILYAAPGWRPRPAEPASRRPSHG